MRDTDVLIIGGGPAGSTLAWALKRAGIASSIVDKANFPRHKVCAGWVTPAVLQELEIDVEQYARDLVLQPIHAFQTGLMGRRPVQSDFNGEPASYGIRRIEFDDYLLRRCGAELHLGDAVKSIRKEAGKWIINESFRASMVVGAGGHFCPVARFINGPKRPELAVTAQEVEFEMSPEQARQCRVDGTRPELFFTPDLKGYGWVFRKANYLNVGLGREGGRKLSGHVSNFCRDLQGRGLIPADLPGKFRGHAYLLYPHAKRKLVGDGVMLVGDSAGLAYPQSGEGIRPAVESALLAAEVIRHCNGDFSAARLGRYIDELERRFGKRQPPEGLLDRLPVGFRQSLAGRCMQNQWFAKNILVKRWFLHEQDKPLQVA